MSLFSGMKIKQKACEKEEKGFKKTGEEASVLPQELNVESTVSDHNYDTSHTGGVTSQFDFILAAEMGQSLASQSSSRTEVQLKFDSGESGSADNSSKEQVSSTTGKLTTSIIGQGNALVDRIKRNLHIDSLDHTPSESPSIYFSKDADNLLMREASNFGEISETTGERAISRVDSKELLIDQDNTLVHTLEYSAEEKFQILQQGHQTRLRNIREKKELLGSEVSKITAGRVESILSITGKHEKLHQLQEEQLQAIETEDYEKAESLAVQCASLESELNILPDMSLNTHFIMKELLKSALELQNREQFTQEKIIKEMKKLHTEVVELEKRLEVRLLQTEIKDRDKIEKCKLQLEKEESLFKEDMEKFKTKEAELEQKISAASQDHEKRKSELETERDRIQAEIKEQEEKLLRLRQSEAELTASITQEDEEISRIVASYQSDEQALEVERQNYQTRNSRLQERKREVMTLEEKQNQELQKYQEEKERHDKLKVDLEESMEAERRLYDASLLEDIWSVRTPPSFHPTKELTDARSNFEDNESKMKVLREELLQGQKKVVSLKKEVSDLEGHIAELEQSKKLSVEGRQFSEAKNLSEEIQRVTGDGQKVQEELESMARRNQEMVIKLQEMQTESQKLKETEENERILWEKQLKDRLVSHFQTLYGDREAKLVKVNCAAAAILQSELQTSCLLLKHLCQKLDFRVPQSIADKMEEVLEGLDREKADD